MVETQKRSRVLRVEEEKLMLGTNRQCSEKRPIDASWLASTAAFHLHLSVQLLPPFHHSQHAPSGRIPHQDPIDQPLPPVPRKARRQHQSAGRLDDEPCNLQHQPKCRSHSAHDESH
jgi:hypothetical protein